MDRRVFRITQSCNLICREGLGVANYDWRITLFFCNRIHDKLCRQGKSRRLRDGCLRTMPSGWMLESNTVGAPCVAWTLEPISAADANRRNRQHCSVEICVLAVDRAQDLSRATIKIVRKRLHEANYGYSSICRGSGRHRKSPKVEKAQGTKAGSNCFSEIGVSKGACHSGQVRWVCLRNPEVCVVAWPTMCGLGNWIAARGPSLNSSRRRDSGSARILLSGRAAKGQRSNVVPTIGCYNGDCPTDTQPSPRLPFPTPSDGRHGRSPISGDHRFLWDLCTERRIISVPSNQKVYGILCSSGRRRRTAQTWTLDPSNNRKVSGPKGGPGAQARGFTCSPNLTSARAGISSRSSDVTFLISAASRALSISPYRTGPRCGTHAVPARAAIFKNHQVAECRTTGESASPAKTTACAAVANRTSRDLRRMESNPVLILQCSKAGDAASKASWRGSIPRGYVTQTEAYSWRRNVTATVDNRRDPPAESGLFMGSSAVAARQAHNLEIVGSSPASPIAMATRRCSALNTMPDMRDLRSAMHQRHSCVACCVYILAQSTGDGRERPAYFKTQLGPQRVQVMASEAIRAILGLGVSVGRHGAHVTKAASTGTAVRHNVRVPKGQIDGAGSRLRRLYFLHVST
jgi:hypothetical protein